MAGQPVKADAGAFLGAAADPAGRHDIAPSRLTLAPMVAMRSGQKSAISGMVKRSLRRATVRAPASGMKPVAMVLGPGEAGGAIIDRLEGFDLSHKPPVGDAFGLFDVLDDVDAVKAHFEQGGGVVFVHAGRKRDQRAGKALGGGCGTI